MKKTKRIFIKIRKGKLKKPKQNSLKFGVLGLKALESGIVSFKQIETIKETILRKTKHKIKIWIKNFNYHFITKKPIGIRMGKGIGKTIYLITKIRAGDFILEFSGKEVKSLIKSVISSQSKLSIKTKIVINYKYFDLIKNFISVLIFK